MSVGAVAGFGRLERDAVPPKMGGERLPVRIVDAQAEVGHVSALGIRRLGPPELAPDRHQIDQRLARPQLMEPEFGELALQGAAEHVDVERHRRVEAGAPQHDVVEPDDAQWMVRVHCRGVRISSASRSMSCCRRHSTSRCPSLRIVSTA